MPPPEPTEIRVTRSCAIPVREIELRFSTSGGPGGQHANRSRTRVEARFDIAGSPSLGPRQRQRLMSRLGAELRVVADDERSQHRNRELALQRLAARLAEALRVERPRHVTRPGPTAERRRLEAKRLAGERKRERARRWTVED